MSRLSTAIQNITNDSYTDNGALTNASSLDLCLDFFFIAPASRNNPSQAVELFKKAYGADHEISLRILQWMRDVRGGAGERQTFRDCFAWLMDYDPDNAIRVLDKTVEIGRWDDCFVGLFSKNSAVQHHVVDMVRHALLHEHDAILAKWMPRKGPIAVALRSQLGLTPKGYRKLIVELSSTVEQKMCSKQWDMVEYSHVPSVAFARYRNAFERNDADRYTTFINKVIEGKETIHASTVFPHDVILPLRTEHNISPTVRKSVNAQWKALPNYMVNDDNVIVVADVSGSMSARISHSTDTSAMDVCIALAMYISERAHGIFKDSFITFSENPQLVELNGTDIADRYLQLRRADWGYNTNIEKVFDVILNAAIKDGISEYDMPKTVLIISDMEFDRCATVDNTVLQDIKEKYVTSGYQIPKIVFWNVAGRTSNVPATAKVKNVSLVSGFSPTILQSVLACDDMSPRKVMLDTVMKSRYDILVD